MGSMVVYLTVQFDATVNLRAVHKAQDWCSFDASIASYRLLLT